MGWPASSTKVVWAASDGRDHLPWIAWPRRRTVASPVPAVEISGELPLRLTGTFITTTFAPPSWAPDAALWALPP